MSAKDVILVTNCLLGEEGSWREIIECYDPCLQYYVSTLVGNQSSDVMQNVWLKVLRDLGKLENPRKLKPWLYRIAYGTSIDFLRKTNRVELPIEFEEGIEEGAIVFDRFDAAAVHRGLSTINIKHCEILTLYFLEELSILEISDILTIPLGTVKSRMYNAKRALRDTMKDLGYE